MAKVVIDRAAFGTFVNTYLAAEVGRRMQIAVDRARDSAPVGEGTLRDSIGFSIDQAGPSGVRGRIYANARHARIVHTGRRAVIANPKDPMVFIASGGRKVFTQTAAAVPPNPFLVDAVRSVFGRSFSARR